MFQRIYSAVGTSVEEKIVRETYHEMKPVNFSKELLEPYVQTHPSNVLAMPVRGVLWSDWGTEIRVMEVLRRTGYVARLNGLSLASRDPSTVEIRPDRQDTPAKREIPRAKKYLASIKAARRESSDQKPILGR
jgi:hypothetical protein